jgi:hypothetical protein
LYCYLANVEDSTSWRRSDGYLRIFGGQKQGLTLKNFVRQLTWHLFWRKQNRKLPRSSMFLQHRGRKNALSSQTLLGCSTLRIISNGCHDRSRTTSKRAARLLLCNVKLSESGVYFHSVQDCNKAEAALLETRVPVKNSFRALYEADSKGSHANLKTVALSQGLQLFEGHDLLPLLWSERFLPHDPPESW